MKEVSEEGGRRARGWGGGGAWREVNLRSGHTRWVVGGRGGERAVSGKVILVPLSLPPSIFFSRVEFRILCEVMLLFFSILLFEFISFFFSYLTIFKQQIFVFIRVQYYVFTLFSFSVIHYSSNRFPFSLHLFSISLFFL